MLDRRTILVLLSSLSVRLKGAISFVLTALSVAPAPLFACVFDMVKPERTQVDWILDAETLVLARPGGKNPFSFEVTRSLIGETDRPPIKQLVNSVTRRKLEANLSDQVLFAYQSETGWHRVAFVDESFRGLLQTALDNRASWQSGMPQSRLEFITSLQSSSVPAHKALAIGELDKVPYADLRQLDLTISSDELLADLWTINGYRYQAIRALLLGLSDSPAAHKEIHGYINRAIKRDKANNLGAFAAAFIELEGVSGVEHLANNILTDPRQSLDKLEQIVMAMSVHHGVAGPVLKSEIQSAIKALVDKRPEAGAIVARQFSLRSDWSQTDILEPLVREREVAMRDLLTISVYLARARENTGKPNGVVNE
ncbi:hypothetical protein FEE96_22195 [Parasedimentitalea maritima]|uniref:HEAT repeat domain-containing protein n=1 Tax=Parasedimentitalea maritima TaxID=2578117 RepID=A0ABY2UPK9_9RHOB|nr:hypothetical protein [Zongyanglinia marina]TLP56001.1 hypothetical protein FEE96_22195 [Zongyanglinia marina]